MRKFLHPLFCQSKRWCRRNIRKTIRHLSLQDLACHGYMTGRTGSGKTTILEQWVYRQWWNTRKKEDLCIIVLDPHGDMVEKMKKFDLVQKYMHRLVYIDPLLHTKYTPCLNFFDIHDKERTSIDLHTQQLTQAFQEMLADTKLTNFMKALLTPCIATLLQTGSCDLRDLQDFMSTTKYEHWLAMGKRSIIPAHRAFFESEFEHWIYDRTKASIYTKLQSLLNSQAMYTMVTGKSTIYLESCINSGKIILFNLSKGKLGQEISETLGRLFIARIKSIALQRARLPPSIRTPIYLIIDEADTFIKGESLEVILKETRKYGLHLLLCTQNLVSGKGQERLKRNLLSNTKIKIIGSNGTSTLKPLSQETLIPLPQLLKTKAHFFWIKSVESMPKLIQTKDVLGRRSALLLKRGRKRHFHHYLLTASPYYKPIVPDYAPTHERIDELPRDMRSKAEMESSPQAKFTLE